MCIIWLASFFNEASIVLKDTDKCFKRENSFNFMSTCHTNVFKEEMKKKMDPLIMHLREFISSIAEFLTWIILDVKWEKILWKKQHFSVHIQNFYSIVALNFLYINSKKRLIVPKDYFNVLNTNSLMLESLILRN